MARTYAESVKYLMEKGGLTEDEAKARLDSRLKAPSSSRPTPAVNGAAAARPLAPTPAQTAPAVPLHPGEYTNVADIRRLDSPRALQVGTAIGEAAVNPRVETLRRPLIEYLLPEERSGASIRAQALGDLKRRENDFAQAPERRARAAERAKESHERSLTEREGRLRAARREAEGAPPASDYLHPAPAPAVVAEPPRPPPAPAPAAKPTRVPSPVPAADWPGLGKADAYILSLKPGADLNQWSPEQRLAFYAERKAASSKE